jgi:hypothetical protein
MLALRIPASATAELAEVLNAFLMYFGENAVTAPRLGTSASIRIFPNLFFGSTAFSLGPRLLFSLLILYTDGRTPWTENQTVARLLPTHSTTQTQNKRTDIMPPVGIEPTISVLELAKTVHALDRATTVIGHFS